MKEKHHGLDQGKVHSQLITRISDAIVLAATQVRDFVIMVGIGSVFTVLATISPTLYGFAGGDTFAPAPTIFWSITLRQASCGQHLAECSIYSKILNLKLGGQRKELIFRVYSCFKFFLTLINKIHYFFRVPYYIPFTDYLHLSVQLRFCAARSKIPFTCQGYFAVWHCCHNSKDFLTSAHWPSHLYK